MEKMLFDAVKTLTGNDNFLALAVILFFVIVMWLSRQVKTIYDKNKENTKNDREKSNAIFSEILNKHNLVSSKEISSHDFLLYVETQLPLIDPKIYFKINDIINSNDDSDQKISDIKKEVKRAVRLMKTHENSSYDESISETIGRVFLMLKDIFTPILISVISVVYIVSMLILLFSDHPFWYEVKLIALLFGIFLFITNMDDIVEQRWNLISKKSVFILAIVYFLLISFFIIPPKYSALLTVDMIVLIIGIGTLVFKRIKETYNNNISQ
ncbi:hypothetical protein NSS90_02840 [Bacillus sp. PS93]|uniref:hypothetical protein n=1 Tax=Bacillus TaxID=1386 RepID=UPI00240DD60E|nr:hypothetical protein [Bacillus subtilis]WFA92670.1 hypothetical protein LFL98_02750 [Bacillus subtilis]